MLPTAIPIFPLPNVVLFPNVFLPLHIFEPRYREMVADALATDRLIGMVLLRPGWGRDYVGRHGAAATRLGSRLRGTAARLSDRVQRRHHARRAAAGRPLQHRAARPRS